MPVGHQRTPSQPKHRLTREAKNLRNRVRSQSIRTDTRPIVAIVAVLARLNTRARELDFAGMDFPSEMTA
jgi:hypothetical protein